MKIIVCGAGQVGLQIAKHLSDERMDVIVIDKSSNLIKASFGVIALGGLYFGYKKIKG